MNTNENPCTIICLTPVKNEEWILDKFLTYTSLWADVIIVADQMSSDNSREIARKYDKVILIDNCSDTFNEPERQKLLINEARKIQGPKLLLALDADEFLTPNFIKSPEWKTMLNSKNGTVIKLKWLEIHPDFKRIYESFAFPFGIIDDGTIHEGKLIHSNRIPIKTDSNYLILNDIGVLHFSSVNTERNRRKYNWYQCYERVMFSKKKSIDIFRFYDQRRNDDHYKVFPENWKLLFQEYDIDITSIEVDSCYWWDKEVLNYFDQYGVDYFKYLNIWETDWCEIAKQLGRDNIEKYKAPKGRFNRKIRTLLLLTHPYKNKFFIRFMDKCLKCMIKS